MKPVFQGAGPTGKLGSEGDPLPQPAPRGLPVDGLTSLHVCLSQEPGESPPGARGPGATSKEGCRREENRTNLCSVKPLIRGHVCGKTGRAWEIPWEEYRDVDLLGVPSPCVEVRGFLDRTDQAAFLEQS